MALPVVLSIHDAYVTFGGRPIFEQLSFCIHEGEKICLVGKNGVGKTTLMHMITGTKDLDGGTRWQANGSTIGYLQQHIDVVPEQSVYDYIFSGLRPEKQNDIYSYMVQMVTEPFELDPQAKMGNLSGGQVRRASLARSLVEEPDILLLDEPTNHLDLAATLWLEEYLKSYKGALLCISHDKTFLANISQKIFWLDRGSIRICPKGFGHFDEWSEMLLEQEERELRNRERSLAIEVEWASRGVKARRKRNMRRVAEMQAERDRLKMDKSLFNKTMQKIELQPITDTEVSSKIVLEFYKVSKSFKEVGSDKPEVKNSNTSNFKEKKILDKFNLRVLRGDRIGILGKNGSGKTSFLKLLLGELEPDSGKIKLAKNVEISYFDQKRRDLDDDNTLWSTLCTNGGDHVDVFGKPRHVCGYLKDFMFDPKDARNRVGTLSGGQKNRLMLAKVLANPGNFLILDEPTNDLDMDTLDMLEEVLSQYKGTLFVVSHDRDFLDQTVTKILAFEGDANVEGYIGGYSDYLEAKGLTGEQEVRNKKPEGKNKKPEAKKFEEKNPQDNNSNLSPAISNLPKKLSYKLQFEFDNLPAKISEIEKELVHLNHILADYDLYMNDPQLFDKSSRRLARKQEELEAAELRWLELGEMQNGVK